MVQKSFANYNANVSVATEKHEREARARAQTAPCVSSESLFGDRGELKIQHNGEQYSLRRTRLGKLILTK